MKKNGVTIAQFTYDGDGKRVKSAMTSSAATFTTYFIGAHYEVSDGVITKYYYAGSQRIAMRANGNLFYLLGDHLGSTSLTTDANGTVISELRYKAWGEVRHASGTTPTQYQYTGQYSHEFEFGLYFYNARWLRSVPVTKCRGYDLSLSRFAQADSIVPPGVQGWDRYTAMNNNPVRYIDPTGHTSACVGANVDPECNGGQDKWVTPSGVTYWRVNIRSRFGITLSNDTGKDWDEKNAKLVYDSLGNIDNALNGKLKALAAGATFKMAEYKLDPERCPKLNCEYSGWTGGTTVIFYTKGNAPIRQMNIYHEFGHLIDNLVGRAPRSALQGERKPSYIGDNGYLNPKALISLSIANDPNYSSVQAIQASDNDPPEQWADIFANYVAGNIDLSKPGPGVDMYKFVTGVLAPYIGIS